MNTACTRRNRQALWLPEQQPLQKEKANHGCCIFLEGFHFDGRGGKANLPSMCSKYLHVPLATALISSRLTFAACFFLNGLALFRRSSSLSKPETKESMDGAELHSIAGLSCNRGYAPRTRSARRRCDTQRRGGSGSIRNVSHAPKSAHGE